MRCKLLLTAGVVGVLFAAGAASTFQLTVDSIMRGPLLVGYAPQFVRWSGNSERVYFSWKQASDPVLNDLDTYVADRKGGGLRKLSHEEAKLVPPATPGDTTRDRRLTVYTVDGDLYLYDHISDTGRALSKTADIEANPRFTRDGKRISFVRSSNLYVMNLDGGALVQMTDIRTAASPGTPEEKKGTDNQEYLKKEERELLQIIKDRASKREADEARKKQANPRKPLRLTARQSIAGLQLSPDESTVIAGITEAPEGAKTAMVPNFLTESAYTEPLSARTNVGEIPGRSRLAFLAVDTGEVKYLDTGLKKAAAPAKASETDEKRTEAPPPSQDREVRLIRPMWSDDGTKVVSIAYSTNNKDWWLMALDPATAKARIVAKLHDDAWVNPLVTVGWMPDNQHVYYLSEQDGHSHLYIGAYEDGQSRQLTSGKWEVFDARLSTDKKRFYLETSEEHFGERHLYSMPLDGGPRRKLTSEPGRHNGWVSPDEASVATVYSFVNKPPELYVGKLGAALEKATTSPVPEFWSHPWKDAPIVSVPARDGAKIPGRLFKPAKSQERGGGPAVIFVHGAGYLQNIHKGWSNYYREYMFHHLLAERGYTVLDIDYRGSAGYGRDWRTAIYRHMGGKDLEDHVDAARWLMSAHGVDPKRIGIYGGSYGGFITLMAMFKHSDLFAAGAALRPVTDWAHYNHGYTSNILNTPQSDAEAFKRSSPIYFADGLKGALLMCHGMVDVNVHAQDTIRLAQRLIELRKENWEMALYPAEDHAFVQPSSWADEYKRILKLFETNLRVNRE